ncbi:MAG TPA: hypothetical protein H9881_04175 [Candidatus Stackebrandtia excrementipullorum]|nr:hypothetical protein [Candidatus Stackebrandtia excrementipullorum]
MTSKEMNGPRRRVARLYRLLSRPAVHVPMALAGLICGIVALWLRTTDPDTLRAIAQTGVDLRVAALAFGLVGAIASARHIRSGGLQRVWTTAGFIGAILGAGLILIGLIGAVL